MAAILRVKRRNEDEPLEALVIACKRFKANEDEAAKEPVAALPQKTVLKFAGTLQNQEDNVVEHLAKTLSKDELKSSFKKHPVDIRAKARQMTKEASLTNRYKVVNLNRSLDTSGVQELDKTMTLIDVEDLMSCSTKTESTDENENKYVYDLYYAETGTDIYPDDLVHVHPLDQELVFDTYRDCHVEEQCESEDSNSESNWRNDYPDSDYTGDSIDEDDMRAAVKNMQLEDDSSDSDFVYALDKEDVDNYGYKYAKYKAALKKELGDESSESETESNSEHSSISDNE